MVAKRKRKLPLRTSTKRTKLLQGVASGMNVSEAGRAAGYANAQSAHRSLHRIRLQLPGILDKMNIPVEKVVKKLKAQMEATETLYFTHQGVVMETRHVEAHAIQLRAAVELAKMLGFYQVPVPPPMKLSVTTKFHVFHSRSSLEPLKKQKNSEQSSSILVPNPKSSVRALTQTKTRDDDQGQNQTCKNRLSRARTFASSALAYFVIWMTFSIRVVQTAPLR